MRKIDQKQIGSIFALVLASVIWGGSFVVTKDTLDYLSPLWQLALRLSIASIPALFLAVILHRKWNKAVMIKSMVMGIAFFAAIRFQNIGMQYVSASKSGFLTTTYVAFVTLIEIVFLRHKVKTRQILAAIICMIGAALLSLQNSLIPQIGDVLILFCGFMYAVHILYADHCIDEDPLLMHIGQILTATVLALLAAFLFEAPPQVINTRCWFGLTYCGLLEVFLCFFLQIIGQRNSNAALASILLSMESVYAAFFAFLFLGDVMSVPMVIGSVMIFSAAVINGR